MPTPEDLAQKLSDFLARHHNARSVQIDQLTRLTGGASKQTWAFDATIEDADGTRAVALVMRSDPRQLNPESIDLEYALLRAAGTADVPVPAVYARGDDTLGMPFFLMERVDGETIPRRLLRDDEYLKARNLLPRQLGDVLARIHRVSLEGLDLLPGPSDGRSPAEHEIDRYEQIYRAVAPEPHPVFDLAFRWLRANQPPSDERVLVHGDYRMGNWMCGPEGLRAVLDWELAHAGDPMEDIGWLCVRSWRFGNDDRPVGGLGQREEFYETYTAACGRSIDPEAIRFWEAFGNLRWGITCIVQASAYLSGSSSNVELASIGRRTAETEWELLNLMETESHAG